jgi:secretion/DNA translocation related TadE-like protein
MSRGRVRRRHERGSATVLAVSLIGLLSVLAVLLAFVGGAVTTRRTAGAAADLAALAGASGVQNGKDGCAGARTVAERNGASLAACTITGLVVAVVIRVETARLLGRVLTMTARSRAGPG